MTQKHAAIALLPLALAACMTPASAPPELTGSTWRFTSIDGQPPVSAETSLRFGERLSASVGCNGLSGPWHVEGGRLLLHGPLVATRMFCEGKMEQEAAVSELLSASPALSIQGNTLTLKSDGRAAVLTRMSAD